MYATGMQGLEIKIKPNNLCNIIFEIKSIGPMLNQPILVLGEIIRKTYYKIPHGWMNTNIYEKVEAHFLMNRSSLIICRYQFFVRTIHD